MFPEPLTYGEQTDLLTRDYDDPGHHEADGSPADVPCEGVDRCDVCDDIIGHMAVPPEIIR